ncbi:MAG: phosphate acyltransferase PlsX, partial [Gammaproteobacteria bacterium]
MAERVIAIDAMGGDFGCSETIPAVLSVLPNHPDIRFILVGDEAEIKKFLPSTLNHRISIQHASETVAMDEPPAQALRFKKDSSMRVAINLVKEGIAHACVSAGNTGALMVTARFVLKTIPGIDRPAICAPMPTLTTNKTVRVLDLGANVDCTPEQLFQFAVMGSTLAAAMSNIEKPKVALLNIGAEDIKGNEQVKQAAKLLEASQDLNYVGFIEADELLTGHVDVIVCDGFAGNIALKSMEGLAKIIGSVLKKALSKNIFTMMFSMISKPILVSVRKQLDPARYNFASFIV